MGNKALVLQTVASVASDDPLTPEDYREFEGMFLKWLDENQDRLEVGGTGDVRELARRSFLSLRKRLDTGIRLPESRVH